MKFGFDADTLDAVWIFYRNKPFIQLFWLIFGFIYAFSFPVIVVLFARKDIRYLLFIPDLYFNLLGWFATWAAIFWSFKRYKSCTTITKRWLFELSLTKINRVKFVIASLGFESFVITLNLLPFSLGYFIIRFLIIASGAIGVFSPIEIFFSFMWIIIYQIALYLWIFFLRILWVVLQNTRLKTTGASVIYFTVILILFYRSIEFTENSVNNGIIYGLDTLEFSKGLSGLLIQIGIKLNTEIHNVIIDGAANDSVLFTLTYLLVIFLIWQIIKLIAHRKSLINYIKSIGIALIVYLGLYQATAFLMKINTKCTIYIVGLVTIIDTLILYIFKGFSALICNISSSVSFSVPFQNLNWGYKFASISKDPLDLIFWVYTDLSDISFSFGNSFSSLTLLPASRGCDIRTMLYTLSNKNIEYLVLQVLFIFSPLLAAIVLNRILKIQLQLRRKKN